MRRTTKQIFGIMALAGLAVYGARAQTATLVDQDVGAPKLKGSMTSTTDTSGGKVYTIIGGGHDIWDSSDDFHYAYITVAGDFDYIVKVQDLQGPNTWTKAELMAREPQSVGAKPQGGDRHISNMATRTDGQNGVALQWRAGANGGSNWGGWANPMINPGFPNAWLRLKRVADLFIGYYSTDGTTWTLHGVRDTSANPMAATLFLGLAVTAHDDADATGATAVFSNFKAGPNDLSAAGLAQVKFYDNTAGGTGTNDVVDYSNSRLSEPATRTMWVVGSETPGWEWGDNYLGQLEAYVIPPATGNYTFGIATDDSSFLYLSTDDKPANKVPISFVNGWTNQRQYTKYPEQTSQAIRLEGGKKYYLQALWVEGGGGDGLAVTMNTTGAVADNDPAIGGAALLPYTKTVGNVVITSQPQSVSVNENQNVSFSIGVDGSPLYRYQWYRNGTAIVGAMSSSYSLKPAVLGDDKAVFSCQVSNSTSTATSANATLTVAADVTPPSILGLKKMSLPNFNVVYSKPVTPDTGTNLANYVLTTASGTAVPITAATISADGGEVTLTAPGVAIGTQYNLAVSNIKDRTSKGNVMAKTTAVLSPQYASGFAVMKVYDNAGFGASQASLDTLVATYANLTATRTEVYSMAETPTWEDGDNYGRSMVGLLTPPETGDYIMHISSDDQSSLWLSTDDSPAHLSAAPIANVTGWTNQREWGKYPEQASSTVHLVKGQKYYFASFQVEGGGGDGLSLGWELPSASGTISVIPGSAVSTLINVGNSSVNITTQPAATTGVQGKTATFTVAATGSSDLGSVVSYQWQKNGADIAGATLPTYTTPKLALSDTGAKYKVNVSVPGTQVASAEVALTVIADTFPPVIVAAGSIGRATGFEIGLAFDKGVDPTTSANAANYTLSKGTVTGARFEPYSGGIVPAATPISNDGNEVVLSVSGVNAGDTVTLTVKNVKDLNNNAITSATRDIKINGTMKWVAVGGTDYVDGYNGATPESAALWPNDVIAVGDKDFDLISSSSANWAVYDEMTFAYEEVTGSFDKVVRVEYQDPNSNWGRAGLEARAALDAGVKHADVDGGYKMSKDMLLRVNPTVQWNNSGANNTYEWVWRQTDGGNNANSGGGGAPNYPNAWMRMARTNQTFYAYRSNDGVKWTGIGTHTFGPDELMPDKLFVGVYFSPEMNNNGTKAGVGHSVVARFRGYGSYAPVAANPKLTWVRAATGLTITFEGSLQSADNVKGPWTAVTGASPLTVPFTGPMKFYRASR